MLLPRWCCYDSDNDLMHMWTLYVPRSQSELHESISSRMTHVVHTASAHVRKSIAAERQRGGRSPMDAEWRRACAPLILSS